MSQHFLVPLDGSRLAEAVLPGTLALARRCGARLTLLHILEQGAPATVHGDRHLRQFSEAEAYLREVRERHGLTDPALAASEVHPVHESNVAASIFAHAGELGADLVVLSTHGRTDWRGWLTGSVPQQVLRRPGPPVFMLQPTAAGAAPAFQPERVLVYLEGTPGDAAGLAAAAGLARAGNLPLHLLMCVPTLATLGSRQAAIGTLLPGTVQAWLDLAERGAADHLQPRLSQLRAEGLAVTAQVTRGDPLEQILAAAGAQSGQIMCLVTQGESGLAALGTDAIAPKLLTRFTGGLLLVHGG